MMSKTHIVFSLLVCLVLFDLMVIDSPLLFFMSLLFGTLLPDIDLPTSYLGKRLWFLSWPISLFSRHRGLFHGLFFGAFVFFVLLLVGLPFSVYFGFLVGFASHLFIDALTPAGIMPLQPLLSFRVRGFVKTGSLLELFFFMGVVMLIILDVYYKAMHLIAVL